MNLVRLALAGLRHHARSNVGVVVGFTIATAVLVGALLVGDSVKGSLRERAGARIGKVASVIAAEDRALRGALAKHLADRLDGSSVAPVLILPCHAAVDGGKVRANELWALGVDERFFGLAPVPHDLELEDGDAAISDVVAERLGVEVGKEIRIFVEAPSALPREMVLAPTEESTIGLPVRVAAILDADEFARFGLRAGPRAPGNVFVSRSWLAQELGVEDVANLIVSDAAADDCQAALDEVWQFEDLQFEVRERDDDVFELTTSRVFLDAPLEAAARRLGRPALGVLTYFVNAIESDRASTPYSMVAAIGDLGPPTGWVEEVLPADLARDQLVWNEWTAIDHDDAQPGLEFGLRWWIPGPERELEEGTRTFTLGAVVPMQGLAVDRDLMPAFPGLEGEADCKDWEPGVHIDLALIREQDEVYWDEHGGAPKAFLPLSVGQELWSNRFGTLTAVRAPDPNGDYGAALRAELSPGQFGLEVRDLAEAAAAGTNTPTDFGGLFLGLSFFLIASALLLAGLLFAFGMELRAGEMGALLAVGWQPKEVRRVLLIEAGVLAGIGAVLGAGLGLAYTRAVLAGLASVWSGAVASTPITYHGQVGTLVGGAIGGVLVALGAARLALRWLGGRDVLTLLGASPGLVATNPAKRARRRKVSLVIALGTALGAGALVLAAGGKGPETAGAFFGAGALLLVSGLAASRLFLARGEGDRRPARSVDALGRSCAARRPSRSMATIALLASGIFLVISIGVHRKSSVVDADAVTSGTGGYALIGRTTLPVVHRLETQAGRDQYALSDEDLAGVTILPLRRLDGDDASCLNLGAPQTPSLLGVDASRLAERGAFSFTSSEGRYEDSPWELLDGRTESGAIPVIGDAASIQWTLKRALGDELTYVDGRGEPFQVRIVGAVQDSILQGSLVMDEEAFRERFPTDRGWSEFLIDAPAERLDEVSRRLTQALGEPGLGLELAADRLQSFRAVQNTYLDIFQMLGGLGVLLGSFGLGIVVLRNALERRSELAALQAVGYGRLALFRVLAGEHGLLLGLGIMVGLGAASLALVPAFGTGATAGIGKLLTAVEVNGVFWVLGASWWAVRGVNPQALRRA